MNKLTHGELCYLLGLLISESSSDDAIATSIINKILPDVKAAHEKLIQEQAEKRDVNPE